MNYCGPSLTCVDDCDPWDRFGYGGRGRRRYRDCDLCCYSPDPCDRCVFPRRRRRYRDCRICCYNPDPCDRCCTPRRSIDPCFGPVCPPPCPPAPVPSGPPVTEVGTISFTPAASVYTMNTISPAGTPSTVASAPTLSGQTLSLNLMVPTGTTSFQVRLVIPSTTPPTTILRNFIIQGTNGSMTGTGTVVAPVGGSVLVEISDPIFATLLVDDIVGVTIGYTRAAC